MCFDQCFNCTNRLTTKLHCRTCGQKSYCFNLIPTIPNTCLQDKNFQTSIIFICIICHRKTLKNRCHKYANQLTKNIYYRKTLAKTLTVEKSFLSIIKDMDKCYKEGNTKRENFWKEFYKLSPE